jgi:hypothetical protein
MDMRRASAIRRGQPSQPNLTADRLKAVRHLHTPALSVAETSRRATPALGFQIARIMLAKIESKQRSVYDFEVLALALGVDVRYLLGVIDDPHLVAPTPLKHEDTDVSESTVPSR